MASVDSKSITETASQVLPASQGRSGIILEHISGDTIWFAVGNAAEATKGFSLSSTKTNYEIPPWLCQFGIYAVCAGGETAELGIAEA